MNKIKGEGIRGLTQAFMFVGTPEVSVTLWDVSADLAKYLSIGLFNYLKQGKPLPEALRQSKLDFLKKRK